MTDGRRRRHRRMCRRHQPRGRGRDRGRRPALRRPRLFTDDQPVCSGFAAYRGTARIDQVTARSETRRGGGLDRARPALRAVPAARRADLQPGRGVPQPEVRGRAGARRRPVGRPGRARRGLRGLLPAGTRGDRVLVAGPVVADVRPGAAGRLDPRPDRAARRRGAPDAAVPGPGRLPGHRGRRRAGPRPGRLPRPGAGRQGAGPYAATRAPHAARVQRTARTWGDIWHVDGVGALLRDELFRRRPADDYSYTDWLYGPVRP